MLVADTCWRQELLSIQNGTLRVETHFQPIVDLSRAVVVGYEALSRFSGPIQASPDEWFEQAERFGCGEALELLTLRQAMAHRERLPENTFLTLNVSPDFLVSHSWGAFLECYPDLTQTVLEVTENRAIPHYDAVRQVIAGIRQRGGFFAVDDAGSGYASLQHVLALRPDFVKLDRVFVADCHLDQAKSAMIEMLGVFAGRIDAWIIAEGIERMEEMHELIRLRTPLAQGYLFGKAAPPWRQMPEELTAPILDCRRRTDRRDCVAWAMEPVRFEHRREEAIEAVSSGVVVVVDESRRPREFVYNHPVAGPRVVEEPMLVKGGSQIKDVLGRATARPEANRFDPLVVTDDAGRLEGIVSLDRLVRAILNEG